MSGITKVFVAGDGYVHISEEWSPVSTVLLGFTLKVTLHSRRWYFEEVMMKQPVTFHCYFLSVTNCTGYSMRFNCNCHQRQGPSLSLNAQDTGYRHALIVVRSLNIFCPLIIIIRWREISILYLAHWFLFCFVDEKLVWWSWRNKWPGAYVVPLWAAVGTVVLSLQEEPNIWHWKLVRLIRFFSNAKALSLSLEAPSLSLNAQND